jgi:uncharacterized membrane protein YgaE (UPF0421/DUF939 family)
MALTNQLIYLVNVKTMRKIFSNYVCFAQSPNFNSKEKTLKNEQNQYFTTNKLSLKHYLLHHFLFSFHFGILFFRHLGCVIFCTMFSVCKARRARRKFKKNKQKFLYFVTSLTKTKNEKWNEKDNCLLKKYCQIIPSICAQKLLPI